MSKILHRSIIFSVILLINYLCCLVAYGASEYEEAHKLYDQGRYAQAAVNLEQLIRTNSKDANVYCGLGLCYLQMNQLDQAVQMFQETIRCFPASQAAPMATYNSAVCYLRMSKFDNAERLLIETIKRYPNTDSASSANKALQALGYDHIDTDKSSTSLPRQFKISYKMQDTLYFIEATVNGFPLQMLVDSGSGPIIIPIEYMLKTGWRRPSEQYDGYDKYAHTGYWLVRVDIALGPLLKKDVPVYILDAGSWPGIPLLGNIFFEGFNRSFDTKNNLLLMTKTSATSKSEDAYTYKNESTLPVAGGGPLPFFVDIMVNGIKTRAIFDTGGHDAIWLNSQQAIELGIDPTKGVDTSVTQGGTRVNCNMCTANSIQLGNCILHNVKVMISDKFNDLFKNNMFIVFGTAILSERDYDFVIDEQAKLIRIRKS